VSFIIRMGMCIKDNGLKTKDMAMVLFVNHGRRVYRSRRRKVCR